MNENVASAKAAFSNNKTLFRNFLILFLLLSIIFSIFSLIIYSNSRKIIQSEFIDVNDREIRNLASSIDQAIIDMKYIISSLEINEMTRLFFSSATPEEIIPNHSRQLNEVIIALQYSRKSISHIYLYSGASNLICTLNSRSLLTNTSDTDWINMQEPDENGFSVFPYAIGGRYPYVLCVAKRFTINGVDSSVAIMLNLNLLPEVSSAHDDVNENLYLISDDNQLIFRNRQQAAVEPIDAVPILLEMDSGTATQLLTYDSCKYSVSRFHSKSYGWSCVLVCNLSKYTEKLSAQNGIILAILCALLFFAALFSLYFTLRTFKPIKELRTLVDQPELFSPVSRSDSLDIDYISKKIVQYMQSNTQLRDELNAHLGRLNQAQVLALQSQINPHFLFNTLNMIYVQATDNLGYDHPLPHMILDVSSLLRYAIDTTKMVSLETELTFIDKYLFFLEHRYKNHLIVQKHVDADTLNANVPRLFIQPILENAVFHGFTRKFTSICILTIQCRREHTENNEQDFLILSIRDNGCGMSAEKLKALKESLRDVSESTSIGLKNVVQRMNLIYADLFTLDIESKEGDGTCFTLRFPYIEHPRSDDEQ